MAIQRGFARSLRLVVVSGALTVFGSALDAQQTAVPHLEDFVGTYAELSDVEALKMQQPHDPDDDQDDQVDQAGKLENLRTIVEKVERKAHVPADNPGVIALKTIVEDKIARLENRLPLKEGKE